MGRAEEPTIEDIEDGGHMKFHVGNITALTLGELTRTDKIEPRDRQRLIPHGCQWARDCEECPWSDCVISGAPLSYNSAEAQKEREGLIFKMHDANTSLTDIAKFLHVHPHTIRRYYYSYKDTPQSLKATATVPMRILRAKRNAEITRLTREGKTDKELSQIFKVAVRTVQRARYAACSTRVA